MHRSQQQQASDHSQYFPVPKSGQVLVRTYVLKYVEFLNVSEFVNDLETPSHGN
jgi:hypothetical protein